MKQELSYDAWGRLRNPSTQVAYAPGSEPALFLGRGYTGHKYLPWFGLVNMNARLYDPALGRFLSPDPYVQMPGFSQNFNRYSYCLNNPLMYIDQDGESFILVAAIIGAWIGMGQAMINSDKSGWGLAGDMFKGALIGGAAGAAGAWAGGAVSGALSFGGFFGGAISGGAGGGLSGFIGGSGNAWLLQGANFEQGLSAGLIGGGIGLASGALLGGLSRGIADYRSGYNFWDGSFHQELLLNHDPTLAAQNYDASQTTVQTNDEILQNRVFEEFGVKEGQMNIKEITTKAGKYGISNDGLFINMKSKLTVGGYVYGNSASGINVHISPYVTLSSDNVLFRSVVGHELVHVYHRFALPFSKINEVIAIPLKSQIAL